MGERFGFLEAESKDDFTRLLIRPSEKIMPIQDIEEKDEEVKENESEEKDAEAEQVENGLNQEMVTEEEEATEEGEEGRKAVGAKMPQKSVE